MARILRAPPDPCISHAGHSGLTGAAACLLSAPAAAAAIPPEAETRTRQRLLREREDLHSVGRAARVGFGARCGRAPVAHLDEPVRDPLL